ncbi:MAG TPA: hypothetical protein VFU47_09555, partial [Armatimonadota bacterium]|nr:hypothetical protein [Armatimonadota bacterium]
VLVERGAADRVSLVVNQAGSGREAARVAAHLEQVARRYLGAAPEYLGFVPADVSVARSVQEQKAVLAAYAHCPATFAVRTLAHTLASSLALPASRPLIAAGSGGKL